MLSAMRDQSHHALASSVTQGQTGQGDRLLSFLSVVLSV